MTGRFKRDVSVLNADILHVSYFNRLSTVPCYGRFDNWPYMTNYIVFYSCLRGVLKREPLAELVSCILRC